MDDRKTRDFSTGPVWHERTSRWFVEIRYPDGSRQRKRFRRQRDAQHFWTSQNAKIADGSWNQRAPKRVTLGEAFELYRAYARVQHRAYKTYDEPALSAWEEYFGAGRPIAKITAAQVEAFKLERAQEVSKATVDKSLAVLKAFFNWCIHRQLAAANPVRRVKLFHEDNARLRYLSPEEFDRLLEAARTIRTSPYLVEKIVLAAHTGLRRGSLFHLRWDQIDLAHSVMRIPRTKSGRPLAIPLNETARGTLQALYDARDETSPYVFPHRSGPKTGEPVMDIKNGFRKALDLAGIEDFTWHDLRHTFASWLMTRGASLRSVADLLGHQSIKMTMRYAHLSPTLLTAEVALLDRPSPQVIDARGSKRAKKGQRASERDQSDPKILEFGNLAPRAGFEPATLRLTGGAGLCSTISITFVSIRPGARST